MAIISEDIGIPAKSSPGDEEKARDCKAHLAFLKEVRVDYETMVDNVITYVNHSRRRITDQYLIKGQKTGLEVYDGTPLSAKNLLVDGMVGYLCPRNLRWFAFTLPGKFSFPRSSRNLRQWSGQKMDEMPEIKIWLEDCEEAQYKAFSRSNFYDVIPEFVGDAAVPGTAHMVIEEDVGRGRINFTVPHFRECWIAENQWGQVDTNYRVYKLTLAQLKDKFGEEKMKEIDRNFPDKLKKNPYSEKEILHAVFPRMDRDGTKINGKNKPVASLWVSLEPLKLIEESGFDSMPTVTWRWRKNNDEWYGRSCSWDAYVTILTGNQQAMSNLIAAHKMVEPPMVAPLDMRGKVMNEPAGWTFVDDMAREMPKPLVTGIQLPFSVQSQERTDKAIQDFFHVPFFLMLWQASQNKVEMTATQVIGMQGEQAAVLGTRIGNLQSEGLNPINDRVFDIEMRAGRMPIPPDVLLEYAGGKRIVIDYLGPLAEAQKHLVKTRGLQAGLQMIAGAAQVLPDILDGIDPDETRDVILEGTGFPSRCIRAKDQIARIRELKNKRRQQQETVEALPKVARAAVSAGKAAEKGSPLMGLVTAMGGGQPEGGQSEGGESQQMEGQA